MSFENNDIFTLTGRKDSQIEFGVYLSNKDSIKIIHEMFYEDTIELSDFENRTNNKFPFISNWNRIKLIDFIKKHFKDSDKVFSKFDEELFNFHYQTIRFKKTIENAIAPCKSSPIDSGYDLTVLYVVKKIGKVTLYGTGITIQPPFGYYFDMVPRSSIIKSGYMLANSVGVIDQGYTGEIMVPLIKIDENTPDLILPNRIVQLIPRKWHHMQMLETCELSQTNRGSNGFGSTG